MDNGDKNIFDTYGKGSDDTWYAVETDTPFGPVRGARVRRQDRLVIDEGDQHG